MKEWLLFVLVALDLAFALAGAIDAHTPALHSEPVMTVAQTTGSFPAAACGTQKAAEHEPKAFQRVLNASKSQYLALRNAVVSIEGATYDRMGGASNRFAGCFQFGAAEIRETAIELGEAPPSRAKFLASPRLQERYYEAYTLSHHRVLMHNAKYAKATLEEKLQILGYAHNQGAGGASRWLNTGRAGKDAFGTSGRRYAKTVKTHLEALKVN